jgi:hypothetical protein
VDNLGGFFFGGGGGGGVKNIHYFLKKEIGKFLEIFVFF